MAVGAGLVVTAGEYNVGPDAAFPSLAAKEPVVGGASVVEARVESIDGAFDDATLAGFVSRQRVDHGPRDRRRLEEPPRGCKVRRRLENLAQQLIRWHMADRPCRGGVDHHIERSQPRPPGPSPHRRLVDGRREPARRHAGEHADETRPGGAVELAPRSAHPRNLDMATKSRKRPVERAHQPRRIIVARPSGTSPLIRAIEEPDARETE